MSGTNANKTYTFFMPKEERIFFKHFHVFTIAFFLLILWLGVFVSSHTAEDAVVFGLVIVMPMYFLRLVFGKRFADSVTLDFGTGTVHFSFSDERGSIQKDFEEIREIKFRFYLTFILDDMRIMVKRPSNKKDAFRILQNVSKIDVGLFKGI